MIFYKLFHLINKKPTNHIEFVGPFYLLPPEGWGYILRCFFSPGLKDSLTDLCGLHPRTHGL